MNQTVWISKAEKKTKNEIGEKGYNLGKLKQLGLPVSEGFILTSDAFSEFIRKNNLKNKINRILERTDHTDLDEVKKTSNEIIRLISNSKIPEKISDSIKESYDQIGLSKEVRNAGESAVELVEGRENQSISIRYSLPEKLYTLRQTLSPEMNVNGKRDTVRDIKNMWKSLFSPKSLYFILRENYSIEDLSASLLIQKMVKTDKSGAIFLQDPLSKKRRTRIEAVWGIGISLAKGSVTPDRYILDKETKEIVKKTIAEKDWKIKKKNGQNSNRIVKTKVGVKKQGKSVLSQNELEKLLELSLDLESKFGNQMVTFGIIRNRLFVFNCTNLEQINPAEESETDLNSQVKLETDLASPENAEGVVRKINKSAMKETKKGEILLTEQLSQEYSLIIDRVSGIISKKGGLSSKLSLIALKLNLPVLIAEEGYKNLKEGDNYQISQGKVLSSNGKKQGQFKLNEEKIKPIEGNLTGTEIKILGCSPKQGFEGGVILKEENFNKNKLDRLIESYSPYKVWLKGEVSNNGEKEKSYGMGGSILNNNQKRKIELDRDKTGILLEMEDVKQLRRVNDKKQEFKVGGHVVSLKLPLNKKGVIIRDFASLMELEEMIKDLKFVLINTRAMKNNLSSHSGDSALLNSIKKVVNICESDQTESSLLLNKVNNRILQKAVDEGVDSLVVNKEAAKAVRTGIAKAEKKFILDSLRKLNKKKRDK